MKRVVAALVALVAAIVACLGFAAPSASAVEVSIPTLHTYGYDSHALPATLPPTITERGPPAYDHAATTYNAVAFRSDGALARPSNAAARVIYAYDAPAIPAQIDSAMGTTSGHAEVIREDLSLFQLWHVAAETEAGLSRALGYSEKIETQMGPRGWTRESIESTVKDPAETHSVWDYTTGDKMPATESPRV